VGGNFGEFGELNVIRQYFTQPNLSPFFVKLNFQVKFCMSVSRDLRCELRCKDINLEISPPLAEAETKFDHSGLLSLYS